MPRKKIMTGLILTGLLGAGVYAYAASEFKPLPQGDVEKINKINTYNGIIIEEHSANSADTEGPVVIGGDSEFPADTTTFTFGASFRDENTTVGIPLTADQYVNVMIGGTITNHSAAYISFEESSDSRGWVVGDNELEASLSEKMLQEIAFKYYLAKPEFDEVMAGFHNQIANANSYLTKIASTTSETDLETLHYWGAFGEVPSFPIKVSQYDETALVINLDEVPEFQQPDGSLLIKGIGVPKEIIENPQYEEVILVSEKEKVTFSGGTYSDYNGSLTEAALTDPVSGLIAGKFVYHFPNATQVTNYAKDKNSGLAPELAAPIAGKDKGVSATGEDLYDISSTQTYGTAVIGSVNAPNATAVLSGGNLNGFVILKDYHQRDGAELHNFTANWIDKIIDEPTGGLQLVKTTPEGSPLMDATFVLYRLNEVLEPEYLTAELAEDGSQIWLSELAKAVELVTNSEGIVTVSGLPEGTYYLKETQAPNGFDEVEDIEFVVTAESITSESLVTQTVIDERQPTISLEGHKIWRDHSNGYDTRPESVTIVLLANGVEVEQMEISDENDWTYSFTNLPQFDDKDELIVYTIEEVAVPGYKPVIGPGNKLIINTLSDKTKLSGEKIWQDGGDVEGTRPATITVELYQNEMKIPLATKEVTAEDNWQYEFTNLRKYDLRGELIHYSVKEVELEGYEPVYDETTNKIVNRQLIDLTGEKRWLDLENVNQLRPTEITVNLLRDNTVIDSQRVTATENWRYTFTGLYKYDETGKAYGYTIAEEAVQGYEPIYDGVNIVNKLASKVIVAGEKVWQDNENANNLRPANITVELYQNDKKIAEQVVTEKENWHYEFTDLPELDDQGVPYVYEVKEQKVPGYEESYDEAGNIINLIVGKVTIAGEKKWDDGDDKNGLRPENVTVNLLRDGKKIDEQIVTEENNWHYEFVDLPQYNQVGVEYLYSVTEETVPGYTPIYTTEGITNVAIPKTSIVGQKVWQDDNDVEGLRPTEITIELYQDGVLHASQVVTSANDWRYEFTDLAILNEDDEPYVYTIKEVPVPGYESVTQGTELVTNTLTGKTDVEGEKKWEDNQNAAGLRPDKVTVRLFQNGVEIDAQEVTAENNWHYTFTNLAKYDAQGRKYTYTVKEDSVPGYSPVYEGHNITNQLVALTSLEGEKIWQDDNNTENLRPEKIKVILYQDGVEFASQEVTAETNWHYEFANLFIQDDTGRNYLYTVGEEPVPGYETIVDDQGNVINTLVGKIQLEGEKKWEDGDNENGLRPKEITVNLLQNKLKIQSQTVTETANWSYTFKDLDKYDDQGKKYVYTVEEEAVPGYNPIYEGTNITNKLIEKTSLQGEKIWRDNENANNLRPTSITVELYQNERKIAEQVVSADSNWQYEFTDLLVEDEQGQPFTYVVKEQKVPNYEAIIDGDGNIVNTLVAVFTLTGEKIWQDGNDAAGSRPNEVVVNLYRNDAKVASTTATSETNWQYQFTDLAKYDETGKEYNYQVEEELVPGYEAVYNGTTITNKLSGTTRVAGQKIWQDNQNAAGLRPESIVVELYQNEVKIDSQTVTAAANWSYEFNDLPSYDEEGNLYRYSVKEQELENYQPIYEEDGKIINTLVGLTSLTGEKIWQDNNNETNLRPDSITVRLLQNDVTIASQVVSAATNWQYAFTDLAKYDAQGVAFVYTVKEDSVVGYEPLYNDGNITNKLISKTSLFGEKIWRDNENAAGLRPTSIEVELYQNGHLIQTQTVSGETNWRYEFNDLLELDENEKPFLYTVQEKDVPNYESILDEEGNITNTLVGLTALTGEKVWQDEDNQAGLRPQTITVRLQQNGVEIATQVVSAATNWQYEFVDLAKYDEFGKPYVYNVTEDRVPGYETIYQGEKIINQLKPLTSLSGEKIWLDDQNIHGLRPESIEVELQQNGNVFATQTVSESSNWVYTFKNLPVYDENNISYVYQVFEKTVENYNPTYDDKGNIINTLTGLVTLAGNKIWQDDDDQAGLRPSGITVKLFRNEQLHATQVVTEEMNWHYAFTNLAKYDEEGKLYLYRIEEEAVARYQTSYANEDIINTLEKEPVIEPDPDPDPKPGPTPTPEPNKSPGSNLPKAGEGKHFSVSLLGMFILVSVGYMILKQRKLK